MGLALVLLERVEIGVQLVEDPLIRCALDLVAGVDQRAGLVSWIAAVVSRIRASNASPAPSRSVKRTKSPKLVIPPPSCRAKSRRVGLLLLVAGFLLTRSFFCE